MQYRRLGYSGLAVSAVGVGCNNFGREVNEDVARNIVAAAVDHGMNLFDVADVYGEPRGAAEVILGKAIRGIRSKVIVATKFGFEMQRADDPSWLVRGGREYILNAIDGSLRRLGVEHIDLYQVHVPDIRTPIEETLSTLDSLVRSGKVRYVGSSKFSGWQIADADWVARTSGFTRFISAQFRLSLLDLFEQADLLTGCGHFGVGVLPYSPLANGLLTGKYRRNQSPVRGNRLSDERYLHEFQRAPWDKLDALRSIAREMSRPMTDVAIGSLLAYPTISSVIAGVTNVDQLVANAEASNWQPTAVDLDKLRAALT